MLTLTIILTNSQCEGLPQTNIGCTAALLKRNTSPDAQIFQPATIFATTSKLECSSVRYLWRLRLPFLASK